MIATFVMGMGCIGLHSTSLSAAQVVDLTINDKQGVYQLVLEMILDAPFEDVRHVVTDYAHIYRIDPSIVESEILENPGASITRVKTLVNDCVFSFCRAILRVEDVREVGDDDIYTKIIPRLSNVRSGTAHWQILPLGTKTRINYTMTLDPGFFVPPLIGNYIVEKKLQEETLICLNNIERIARIHGERLRGRNVTLSRNTASEHGNAN